MYYVTLRYVQLRSKQSVSEKEDNSLLPSVYRAHSDQSLLLLLLSLVKKIHLKRYQLREMAINLKFNSELINCKEFFFNFCFSSIYLKILAFMKSFIKTKDPFTSNTTLILYSLP